MGEPFQGEPVAPERARRARRAWSGPAPRDPRALLGLVWLPLALACATGGGAPTEKTRARDLRVERPEAPPDYDVLVGSLAALDGDLARARDGYARAAAKDPDSAYLHRKLGRLSAQLDDMDGALRHARRAVELDSGDSESRLLLGRLYRIRRDVPGAESVLLDEEGQPIDAEAALLLYQVYLESGRYDRALELSEQLVADHPDVLGGHMAVATVYEKLGRPDAAEAAVRVALEHHPGRFVLYGRLARMHRTRGDREGEIAVYREVLEEHPRHYGTLVSLAEAQITMEDYEGAIETYAQVIEFHPEDRQSIRRLASLEFTAGHHERAQARLLDAAERFPEDWEIVYSLGQVQLASGDEEAALATLARIPRGHELYLEAHLRLAEIHESRGDFAAALVEVEAVRAERPSRTLTFHAAGLHWRSGDLPAGVALLEALVAEKPDDDEALYQLGVLYGMANEVDRAIEYMRAALELNPDNAQALNFVGYTWAERGENLDEAEQFILRALELRPDDGYITDSLGWVYYMRAQPLFASGRVTDGRELLERARQKLSLAAELTGGDPVVSEHLGDVHLLLEDRERALQFYEEAVSLDPRADEQPQLFEKLEELRRELGSR